MSMLFPSRIVRWNREFEHLHGHKEVEMLLGMFGEEIIEAQQKVYLIKTQFFPTKSLHILKFYSSYL